MPRDEATLLDILTAAQLAVQFRGDLTKDEFGKDLKTRAAVLHQLLIIGEAVKRLSAELRTEHPEIPWKSVAGMRDQLIHGYDRVDLDEVWTTLTRVLRRERRGTGKAVLRSPRCGLIAESASASLRPGSTKWTTEPAGELDR